MLSGAATSPTVASRKRARAPSPASDKYRDDNRGPIQKSKTTSIHASLSTLFDNEKFSDMIIVCGGRQFKAHRAVVCTQSSIIDTAMTSNFKDAALQSIELPKDDPDIVERLLEFLYTGTYSDGLNFTCGEPSEAAQLDPVTVLQKLEQPACGNRETDPLSSVQGSEQEVSGEERDEEYDEEQNTPPDNDVAAGDENNGLPMDTDELAVHHQSEGSKRHADPRNDMTLHLRLYVIAVKYDVPALRLLARDRFHRAAELVWEVAECFSDVVDELYQTTPPEDTVMKETVCRLVGAAIHVHSVRYKLKHVLEKHGEFAFGVMDYASNLGTLVVSDD